jgi:hypothetical protein
MFHIEPLPFGKNRIKIKETLGTNPDRIGILCYSLYGNYDKYYPTLLKTMKNVPVLLPKWQVRVYTDSNIPINMKKEILTMGVELIIIKNKSKAHEGALWRYLGASESVPFVSFDADDDVDKNIADNINKWLESDKQFCVFNHSHPFNKVMAGSWGSRNCAIPDIKDRLEKYNETFFGFDEAFMINEIVPLMEEQGMYIVSKHHGIYIFAFIGLILIFVLIAILWSLWKAYQLFFI